MATGERGQLGTVRTVEVGADVGAAVAAILAAVQGAEVVTIESGAVYIPEGTTPQAAAQMARAFVAIAVLVDRVEVALVSAGVEVVRVPRARWVARVVGHASRGDAEIRAALASHYSAEDIARMVDDHQRDAGGLLAFTFMPEPEPARIDRASTPDEATKIKTRVAHRESKRRARNRARVARGELPKAYKNPIVEGKHPSDLSFELLMASRERAN